MASVIASVMLFYTTCAVFILEHIAASGINTHPSVRFVS